MKKFLKNLNFEDKNLKLIKTLSLILLSISIIYGFLFVSLKSFKFVENIINPHSVKKKSDLEILLNEYNFSLLTDNGDKNVFRRVEAKNNEDAKNYFFSSYDPKVFKDEDFKYVALLGLSGIENVYEKLSDDANNWGKSKKYHFIGNLINFDKFEDFNVSYDTEFTYNIENFKQFKNIDGINPLNEAIVKENIYLSNLNLTIYDEYKALTSDEAKTLIKEYKNFLKTKNLKDIKNISITFVGEETFEENFKNH